jgi:hypothetical protein
MQPNIEAAGKTKGRDWVARPSVALANEVKFDQSTFRIVSNAETPAKPGFPAIVTFSPCPGHHQEPASTALEKMPRLFGRGISQTRGPASRQRNSQMAQLTPVPRRPQ